MWSICRMEFFLTIPKSTRMPSAEKMLSDCWKMMMETSANGTRQRQREQDRDRVEPRLELRRQDQVHEDEREQEREAEVDGGRAHLLRVPVGPAWYAGSEVQRLDLLLQGVHRGLLIVARLHVGHDRDLAAPAEAVDLRTGPSLSLNRATLSSSPRRAWSRARSSGSPPRRGAPLLHGAGVDLVLLAALVVGRDLAPADQDAERVGDVGDLTPRSAAFLRSRFTASSGLPRTRVVSTSTTPGTFRERRDQPRGVSPSFCEVGPADDRTGSPCCQAAAEMAATWETLDRSCSAGELRQDRRRAPGP